MPRTHAFGFVRRALRQALGPAVDGNALVADASSTGPARQASMGECIPRREFGRRAGLAAGALTAAQLGLGGCHPELREPHSVARIAIVGAGMAGLVCAHRLARAGVIVAVYDASSRVGGRIWTARGKLQGGQHAELGGELIDSGHRTLFALAEELELDLDDLAPAPGVRADTFYFRGRLLRDTDLAQAFRPIAIRMQHALQAARRNPGAFADLDARSLAAWLDAQPELDVDLKQLLSVAYTGEYGLPAEQQSVFNLLWLIDSAKPDPFRVFGDSDERFHTHLGNDQFPARLAAKLGHQVQLGHRLTRVRELAGKYRLSFDREGGAIEPEFDAVVFAVPFSVLRQIDLDLPLPPLKRRMIKELGYGTNAKLVGQFRSRVWLEQQQASGTSITDLPVQATWDSSRGQRGTNGLLSVFLGGAAGLAAAAGSPDACMRGFLPHLDTIFPGTAAEYCEGSALRMHWPSMQFARGSYACYQPGQAAWSGRVGERVGHLHFCGEHTSAAFQGYMEGAAESGERAAQELLSDLHLAAPPRRASHARSAPG